VARPGLELGKRRLESDAQLEGRLAVAPGVEVGPRAEGQLLARQGDVARAEERREPLLWTQRGRTAGARAARRPQLERLVPAPLGHLLALAQPDPHDQRLLARRLAHGGIGCGEPVRVQHPPDHGERLARLGLAVGAAQPAPGLGVARERGGGDERHARDRHLGRGGLGRDRARAATAQASARAASGERCDDQDVRRLARVPAHHVAPFRRPERQGQLDLHEAEERAPFQACLPQSPRCARLPVPGVRTLIEYFDGCVSTVGLSILPRRSMSLVHWPGLSTALSWRPSFELAP
jgi:hypothetical protein